MPVTRKSGANATAALRGWHVETNVWNPQGLIYGSDYTTSISYDSANLDNHPVWNWQFPAATATNYYTVHAYEEIMYGGSPWWDSATGVEPLTIFPLSIASLAALNINYDVSIAGNTDGFNIAFEVWLESTNGSGSANLTNEVMVWFHHGSMTPGGNPVGTYTAGVYSGPITNASNWNSWNYTAVMSNTDLLSGTFDLVPFLAQLKSMGIITGNEYIYGLEFGAEVETGTGSWTVNKLEYDILNKNGTLSIVGGSYYALAHNDFGGDGKSDILWQNDSGQAAIWTMNGLTQLDGSLVGGNPGPAWHVVGSGDFFGNGVTDILWQNDDGATVIWTMSGLDQTGSSYVGGNPGPSWHVKGTGDFFGNGRDDILWQNDNGQAAIWQMNGYAVVSGSFVGGNPGTSWHIVGTGDFNRDGTADIVWQNDNGQAAIWTMDGFTQTASYLIGGNPGPTWHIKGVGDFYGTGQPDILWQNDNGQAAIWTMNGVTQTRSDFIGGNPGPTWHIVGVGDYSGDGKADILWQNDNGQAAVWTMDGVTQLGGSLIGGNPGTTWHIPTGVG